MDVLLGFLIGLAYPPVLAIVVALMVAGRSAFGLILGVVAVITFVGPIIWAMTFISLGFVAGLAAFAGWVLGLGIAGLIVALFLASRLRRLGTQPPSAVNG